MGGARCTVGGARCTVGGARVQWGIVKYISSSSLVQSKLDLKSACMNYTHVP